VSEQLDPDAGYWSADDTTAAAIEDALRKLLVARASQEEGSVPARVINMVVIVDREWKGEIAKRIDGMGRYHPSRTILCAIEPKRQTLSARATLSTDRPEGGVGLYREDIEIDLGERHLPGLPTIVDGVLAGDVATMIWSPHGHDDVLRQLLPQAGVVLVDSIDGEDAGETLEHVARLAEDAYVVDLAWLRSQPWRERLAAAFDPPKARDRLEKISAVTVRHHPTSRAAAFLLMAWLATRLGWEPEEGAAKNGSGDIALTANADPELEVPGLQSVTVEAGEDWSLTLDRGPGGLTATERHGDEEPSSWRLLGASRGESGILGEGVRQALLRDPTYVPAARAAKVLAG
jgi:glucose-6-phosphate dehydrogenase assembly protein OpcA